MPPVWRYPVARSARPAAAAATSSSAFAPNRISLKRIPLKRSGDGGQPPPSRRERVGLIAGRSADHLIVGGSADRRRWLGAPLARGDSARVRPTRPSRSKRLIFQCRLIANDPVAERRGRRPQHHHQFAPNRIALKRKRRRPRRRERVSLIAGRSADHLIVGRIADRRRWLGAPLARGDSARVRPTPRGRYR